MFIISPAKDMNYSTPAFISPFKLQYTCFANVLLQFVILSIFLAVKVMIDSVDFVGKAQGTD